MKTIAALIEENERLRAACAAAREALAKAFETSQPHPQSQAQSTK